MDFTEYRQRGKEMVDYIADYLENIRDRRVFPDVKPGYMKNLLPDSAPLEGEKWETIFGDVERVIMPGITHWQSPHMHAYFPALNSFPSLLGDMLADAINCLGFTWASSPACTELEIIVMNWLGKMINLPDDFLHLSSASRGGGVVQTTASEATLVCLLAGRTKAIQRFHERRPGYQDAEINARLVAYCSDQAHSSVEKAALIGLVRMRYIEADENLSMRGQLLRDAIEDDIRQGLVPFWVCATLGTTGSCSFDNLEEIGIVCREFNLWLHVDAAYAGSAFICPEFRTWLKGIERADSIAFNPSKWLMIHFDATALWVKDSTAVHRTFNVEPLYLQHENSGVAIDYMHWQIPLSRRFRALKIWFVLRNFGIKGLQRHIREGVRLAQKFEALVLADHRFEIPAKRHLGLVVFRIKGENEITERLLKRLNHRGNLHCIPSSLKGKYVIRFTVTSTRTTVDDILRDWMEIKNAATAILDEMNITISNRVYLKDTKEKCEGFGSSLLLSNSPLSPKIVNGSFAALFDADEFLAKTYAGIRIAHQESPSMRRRVRGILMSGKQFSLDSHMDVVVQTSMNSHTTNSKMVDSYGKTSSMGKNEERDAICEDEESLEDCEMNWLLNTALHLNPTNYLAVLSNQQLTPIDIIHRRNNLTSFLTRYATKYDKRNYTKSVNSIRTPLTQYQLYNCPRQISIIQESQEIDFLKQYPGKRYVNLDLSLHNDKIFTDTIYNLPTPTEEVIPIIITADTPTTSTKCIPEIEDPIKLHPPICKLLFEVPDELESSNNTETSNSTCEDTKVLNNISPSPLTNTFSMLDLKHCSSNEKCPEVFPTSSENLRIKSVSSKVCAGLEDFSNPLPSCSTLIPIVESIDETKDLTNIFPPFTTQIATTTNVEQFSKVHPPITASLGSLKSSGDSQEISEEVGTSKINLNETSKSLNYFFISKSSTTVEDLRDTATFLKLNFSNESQDTPKAVISSLDYLSETSTDLNYFVTSEPITEDFNKEGNLPIPLFSTFVSNQNYSNDSLEIPQVVTNSLEDLNEITANYFTTNNFSIVEQNSLVSKKLLNENNNQFASLLNQKSSDDSTEMSLFVNTCSEDISESPNATQLPKSATLFDDYSILQEVSNESNMQPQKSSTVEDFSLLKVTTNESKDPPRKSFTISDQLSNECVNLPFKSCTFADFSIFKDSSCETNSQQPLKLSPKNEESSVLKKPNPKSNIIRPKSSSLAEDTLKKSTEESYMLPLKSSSLDVKTSSVVRKRCNQPKIFSGKPEDNSSSSDDFLESVRQPSNDSEGSSSALSSSSLDLL